jgi:predicted RNase H-like nuclease (RuvC/YqgF family)
MSRDFEKSIERLKQKIANKEGELKRYREDLKCLEEEYSRVKNKDLISFIEDRNISAKEAMSLLCGVLDENK